MEDVVALRARDGRRGWVGFMTWGRLWDPVDDTELIAAIRNHLGQCGIDEDAEIKLCESLAEVKSSKYFYEAFLDFAWKPIPFGDDYFAWRERMKQELSEGREIYFLTEIHSPESLDASGPSTGSGLDTTR